MCVETTNLGWELIIMCLIYGYQKALTIVTAYINKKNIIV